MSSNTTAQTALGLTAIAERLKTGQKWLISTRQIVEANDGCSRAAGIVKEFWTSYEAWDRMEREARAAGDLVGCPIGHSGCDDDAPIRCGHCADLITQRQRARGREGLEPSPRQAALFNLGPTPH